MVKNDEFEVSLLYWIKANGKKIPNWSVSGSCNGVYIYGKLKEYCLVEHKDWDNSIRNVEGALIMDGMIPFKCPLTELHIHLPISFLYDKEKLREVKIDNIINED